MKVRFLLISLLAGLGMVAASCSKTDPTPDPKPDPKIDDIIIAHRGKPVLGKFDAAYCEEKYKLWTKAGVRLSFYTIDTDDQINWYLSHKDNVVACTNYPVKLLKAVK